jgi:hypothetical protein
MHHKKISNADWKVIEEKFELLEREITIIRGQVGLDKFIAKQFSYVYVILLWST